MSKQSKSSHASDDIYSRVDYRRFVAWPTRIQREQALLEFIREALPEPSLLDLGCGTGEHSRFFASLGCQVIGIDRSQDMLEKARQESGAGGPAFLEGDICRLPDLLDRRFGGAISLGNTLPHLCEDELLQQLVDGVGRVLVSGGLFLFQILNYTRIFEQGIRHLPLNFREQDGHELVFLRLMKTLPEGRVLFCPSTLRFDPSLDEPIEVVRSKTVELRGWQRKHLTQALESAGFRLKETWGDMEFHPFEPAESTDLVVLAEKQ